jgi:hypothetical protein
LANCASEKFPSSLQQAIFWIAKLLFPLFSSRIRLAALIAIAFELLGQDLSQQNKEADYRRGGRQFWPRAFSGGTI